MAKADDDLDRIMADLKSKGITISTTSAPGASFEEQRPASVIARAAKKHGIYYEKDGK